MTPDNKRRDEMAIKCARETVNNNPSMKFDDASVRSGYRQGYDQAFKDTVLRCPVCGERYHADQAIQENQGREDASPRYMLGETTQPRVPNKTEHYIGVTPPGEIEGLRPKDPQPTERREFWITDNTDNSGLTVDTEFNHSRHFGSCNVIHVREIGNGLIPVEDVRPLLDAINSFNKAKWVFDDNWRKTEDAQKLYRAFNEFLAKHPGLK